jgi:hypothetical protein
VVETFDIENAAEATVTVYFSNDPNALVRFVKRSKTSALVAKSKVEGSIIPPIAVTVHGSESAASGRLSDKFLTAIVKVLVGKRIDVGTVERVSGVSSLPWQSAISSILSAITTPEGQVGNVTVIMYVINAIDDSLESEGAIPPWKRTVEDFRIHLNAAMGLDVQRVPEGLESEAAKRMRAMYDHIILQLSGGISDRYIKGHRDAFIGKFSMRDYGENQGTMWSKLASDLEKYCKHPRADFVMPLIESYWVEDARTVHLSEKVELPTMVRQCQVKASMSTGRVDFNHAPSLQPAVVTRLGLDEFIKRGISHEQNTGWISPEMFKMLRFEETSDGKAVYLAAGAGYPEMQLVLQDIKEEKPNPFAHISYSSPWSVQVPREQKRILPFTIVTYCSQLLHHLRIGGELRCTTEAEVVEFMFDFGLGYIILIACMCACEWHACNSRRLVASGFVVDKGSLLKSWAAGSPSVITQWMNNLKARGKRIDYYTANDVGYSISDPGSVFDMWEEDDLTMGQEMRKGGGGADPGVPTAPFIETISKRKPPRVTASGITSNLQARCAIALSALVQYGNMSDMDNDLISVGEQHLWGKVMSLITRYMLKRPGAGGKDLNKAFIPVVKCLLACPKLVEVPINITDEGPIDCGTKVVRYEDGYAQQMLTSQLEIRVGTAPQTWERIKGACARKVNDLIPGLGVYVDLILRCYGSMPLHVGERRLPRVVTYLCRPDHIGGYMFTNPGGLSAYGYQSDVQKAYADGLDDNRQPASHEYMAQQWREVMRAVSETPTTKATIMQQIRKIMKGTSGGDDKMYAKTNRDIALGTKAPGGEEKKVLLNTNKKNAVISAFAYLFMRRGEKELSEILLNSFSPHVFNSTGERSVPSRLLRIIFNIDNISQIVQIPISVAVKDFMKKDPTYSMEHKKKGQMFTDNYREFNASIQCVFKNAVCNAYDASSLDQKEGTGDRRVFISVVEEFLTHGGKGIMPEFQQEFGITYFEWVKAWAVKRLKNYFTVQVPGAPTQAFMCNTQASGEYLTGAINTITSVSIVRYCEEHVMMLPKGKSHGGVWGDDIWWAYDPSVMNTDNIMDMLELFERGGKACGQDYSYKKAYSGKLVHFLQNFFYAGQTFTRSVPLTHERWFEAGIRSLPSLIAKMNKICQRGGNITMCQMLIMTCMCATAQKVVFGKKFIWPPAMILYPGGILNSIPIPNAAQNSKAWLYLNALNLGFTGTMLEPPKPEEARLVGKRVTDWLVSQKKEVKVHICGKDVVITDLETALQDSFHTMTNPKRVPSGGNSDNIRKILKTASIHMWNTNEFHTAVGVNVMQGPQARWFMEKEMEEAGAFPGKSPDAGEVALKYTEVEPKSSYRIGDYLLELGYSGFKITVKLAQTGTTLCNDYIFTLKHLDDRVVQEYKGRWHARFSDMDAVSIFLLFTGTAVAPHSVGSPQDLLRAFKCSHFRNDLTPDAIVNLCMQESLSVRRDLLYGIGFMSPEVDRQMTSFQGIGELRDEKKEIDKHTSTPEALKDAAGDRFKELLTRQEILSTNVGGVDLLTTMVHGTQLKQGILHLFAELCWTGSNVNCNENPNTFAILTSGKELDLFSIPRFSLSKFLHPKDTKSYV